MKLAGPIAVSTVLDAPIDEVWTDIARLETHVEWMADAESIEFLSEQRAGVGTRMRVETRVGPLRTADVMEFTAWEPPHRMAIRHQGLVTGEGVFELAPLDGDRTRFTWRESLTFKWYLGGPVTAFVARPVLKAVWARNLSRLQQRYA